MHILFDSLCVSHILQSRSSFWAIFCQTPVEIVEECLKASYARMLLLLKAAESVARCVKQRKKSCVYWKFLSGAQIAIPPIRGHFVCAIERRNAKKTVHNFMIFRSFCFVFDELGVIVFQWRRNRRRELIVERRKLTRDVGRKKRFVYKLTYLPLLYT